MKLICDTNVIIDVITAREPYYTDSAVVLNMCEEGDIEGMVTVTSLSDLFYVTRKLLSSKEKAYDALKYTTKILRPCAVSEADTIRAVKDRSKDFEDALIAYTAETQGCDYIVTRNTSDFRGFSVKAIEPSQLLDMFML